MKSRKSPIDSSYCCSMSWISSWNTPATATAIAPGKIARRTADGLIRNAAPSRPAAAPAAISIADTGGEAQLQRQHVEQRGRQRDEDRLQRHHRQHRGQHRDRHAGGGAGEQTLQRPSGHRTGATGDHQQHGLAEAQRTNDDPALMQHQQHADHGEMHRAGAERQADQDGAAHHARFLAMRSPSRPCGRKISTMISSVNAIRSRNW